MKIYVIVKARKPGKRWLWRYNIFQRRVQCSLPWSSSVGSSQFRSDVQLREFFARLRFAFLEPGERHMPRSFLENQLHLIRAVSERRHHLPQLPADLVPQPFKTPNTFTFTTAIKLTRCNCATTLLTVCCRPKGEEPFQWETPKFERPVYTNSLIYEYHIWCKWLRVWYLPLYKI